jgi:hypothetical protein
MERRRQGLSKGSPQRWLGQDVEVRRATGETDDELVVSVLDEVFRLIELDADGNAWLGKVHLFNDNAEKRSDKELAQVDVRFDDGSELATASSESVAIVQTVRVFLESMCKQMVAILGATAQREVSTAQMGEALAKWSSRSEQAAGKWAYKMQRDANEVEREKVKATERTAKQSKRWDSVTDIAEVHKDIVKEWSDLFREAVKAASATTNIAPPTQAEVDAVFGGEVSLDALRALASEMIAEADYAVRRKLAKQFKSTVMGLPTEQQQFIMLRAANALGAERAKDCFRWLSSPRPTRAT